MSIPNGATGPEVENTSPDNEKTTEDGGQENNRTWKKIKNADVFTSFRSDRFEKWDRSQSPDALLEIEGGSFGVSGPRGAGKTWFIQQAVDLANAQQPVNLSDSNNDNRKDGPNSNEKSRDDDQQRNHSESGKEDYGVGIWAPVPSEYKALPFLETLIYTLADAVVAKTGKAIKYMGRRSNRQRVALGATDLDASEFDGQPNRFAVIRYSQVGFDALLGVTILLLIAMGAALSWEFSNQQADISKILKFLILVAATLLSGLVASQLAWKWVTTGTEASEKSDNSPSEQSGSDRAQAELPDSGTPQAKQSESDTSRSENWLLKYGFPSLLRNTPSRTWSYLRRLARSSRYEGRGASIRTNFDNVDSLWVTSFSVVVWVGLVVAIRYTASHDWSFLVREGDQAPPMTLYNSFSILAAVSGGALAFIPFLSLIIPAKNFTNQKQRNQQLRVVKRRAERAKEWVRYSSSERRSSEFGAEGGKWLTGLVKFSRSKELVERPYTVTSLVKEFADLAERAQEAMLGNVVIGIDELDKIDDEEDVRKLLRDIKGIFAAKNVHFLMSISDEAASAYRMGSFRGRDEFSSSFNQVFAFGPLRPAEAWKLLDERIAVSLHKPVPESKRQPPATFPQLLDALRRGVNDVVSKLIKPEPTSTGSRGSASSKSYSPAQSDRTDPGSDRLRSNLPKRNVLPKAVGHGICVLAGGVPREILRIADIALKSTDDKQPLDDGCLPMVIPLVLRQESHAFLQQVLGSPDVDIDDKNRIFSYLGNESNWDPKYFIDGFANPPAELWDSKLKGLSREKVTIADSEQIVANPRTYADEETSESGDLLTFQSTNTSVPKRVDGIILRDGKEELRRLLLRLRVAAYMASHSRDLVNPVLAANLQKVVIFGEKSAEVAKQQFESSILNAPASPTSGTNPKVPLEEPEVSTDES